MESTKKLDIIYPSKQNGLVVVNLCRQHSVRVNDKLLRYCCWKELTSEEFGLLLNNEVTCVEFKANHMLIIYPEYREIKLAFVPIPEQPPKNEALFQIAHYYSLWSSVRVKARYGDQLEEDLRYQSMTSPILLYAPMDIPIDITEIKHGDSVSLEKYCSKKNTWTLLCIVDNYNPLLHLIEYVFT
ncbi:hypothetical protein [Pontibacillus yanchengensis]|uniref:Uncharacterized protein n=1 Tax=Pontibacillus yanchengensis Y32 TaxID=1385514 RepID=A0A0A2T8U3_9BACI|nr:hypothetical protein [Pontibacillus yanchengensis]KGP72232.1 hypothetical protein N782_08370 [Pontibacillus yanchengensis Y32]